MNDFLPVGSVVLLKSGKKPISIIGYKMSSLDNKLIYLLADDIKKCLQIEDSPTL